MDLNLKRFLANYGKIILMPEILMGSNSCTPRFLADRYEGLVQVYKLQFKILRQKILES
jgi:hypothetical protein